MASESVTTLWPRKGGYYWMYSPELGDWVIVEVSGSVRHRTQCFYIFGDQRPKARSWMEQKFGHSCKWLGPLKSPSQQGATP